MLEAVRLGGSNPTALWRKITQSGTLIHNQGEKTRKIAVKPGAMLWLDRQGANQDGEIFVDPFNFNPDNIAHILRNNSETFASILSLRRFEINSFSMVNTVNSPRKCPARLFSVYLQSWLIRLLYNHFDVESGGIDTTLKPFSSMPRPANAGWLKIESKTKKGTSHAI